MSEKWPPRSFQTSKPLGNMTALESQELVAKEVGIASLVFLCSFVWRFARGTQQNKGDNNSGQKTAGQDGLRAHQTGGGTRDVF